MSRRDIGTTTAAVVIVTVVVVLAVLTIFGAINVSVK